MATFEREKFTLRGRRSEEEYEAVADNCDSDIDIKVEEDDFFASGDDEINPVGVDIDHNDDDDDVATHCRILV